MFPMQGFKLLVLPAHGLLEGGKATWEEYLGTSAPKERARGLES